MAPFVGPPRADTFVLQEPRQVTRLKIAPGEGERRAQRGLVPQYEVGAAEKIYPLLADGWLNAIGIADSETDTLTTSR